MSSDIPKHYQDACEPNHVSWIGESEYADDRARRFRGGILYTPRVPTNAEMRGGAIASSAWNEASLDGGKTWPLRVLTNPRIAFAAHFAGVPDPWAPLQQSLCAEVDPTAQIGNRGFSFARDDQQVLRLPSWGGVKIGKRAEIGPLCTVDRASFHGRSTTIGTDTRLETRCHVGHDCQIGDRVILCHGCVIAGWVTIEDDAYLGIGVLVKPRVTIGKGAKIGAGAVVIRDVPPGEVWAGVPARRLR